MCNYSSRAALASLALMLVIGAAATATAEPRDPNIIYSSIPKQLPGNVASEGPEAYAFKELGDGIVPAPGSGGTFDKVKVILSSWGCTSGHWYSSDCVTQPRNAKFNHPITLNIYSVI